MMRLFYILLLSISICLFITANMQQSDVYSHTTFDANWKSSLGNAGNPKCHSIFFKFKNSSTSNIATKIVNRFSIL